MNCNHPIVCPCHRLVEFLITEAAWYDRDSKAIIIPDHILMGSKAGTAFRDAVIADDEGDE